MPEHSSNAVSEDLRITVGRGRLDTLTVETLAGTQTVVEIAEGIAAVDLSATRSLIPPEPEPPDTELPDVEPPTPEPPEPSGEQVSLVPGYGYVEVAWSSIPNAVMYQLKRDGAVIQTLPGTFYLDAPVASGQAHAYTVAAKFRDSSGHVTLGADSAPSTTTPWASLPPEARIDTLNGLIGSAAQGATVDVPDGIYRATDAKPLGLNKPIHLRSGSRKAWILGSRNWAQGGEAGNSWSQVGGYWRSSRAQPNLQPNDGGADITNSLIATTYCEVVGWTDKGVPTRFAVVNHGSSPGHGQWCYESGGDKHIRLGTDPSSFQRIEVTESTRWAVNSSHNVKLEGLTFRHCSSSAQGDPIGNNNHNGFEIHNCVVGDTHGCGLNIGHDNVQNISNFVVSRCLLEWCRGTGISGWQANGGYVTDCRFIKNGISGYNWRWQGGDSKMAGCWNYRWNHCVSVDGTRGVSIWADGMSAGISNRNYSAYGNKVIGCLEGPAVNHEISQGPAEFSNNCFLDCSAGNGCDGPTFHLSTAGQATVTNNLIRGGVGGEQSGRVVQVENNNRPDAPSVRGQHHLRDNVIIKQATSGNHQQCCWSNDNVQGLGSTWERNRWHTSGGSTWLWGDGRSAGDVNGWNGLTGGSDTTASDAERDAALSLWGVPAT